ncbi:hypothetical protein Tco_1002888 [Tanacetum coccineum]|uniref:Uncharacterized protein n=1 Tax=Tanacetum coccineum TaxID=301880 RepID=A0ABQ5F8W7_9ASTR
MWKITSKISWRCLIRKEAGVSYCKVLGDKVEEELIIRGNKDFVSGWKDFKLLLLFFPLADSTGASVYLLPTTVIHDLEKLFKRFLWNAGDSAKGKARVSWKVEWKECFYCMDKLVLDGPLALSLLEGSYLYARLDDNARVADMIRDNQWVWPDGWRENFTILGNFTSTVNLVNKDDKVLWVTNAGDKVKFNTKQCDFPKNVWAKMVNLAFKMKMQVNLHDIVDSLAGRKGKNNIGNVVGKLVLAATVYFIWHERNFRLFKGEKK